MKNKIKEIVFSTVYRGSIIKRAGNLELYKKKLEEKDFSDALNPNTVCFEITLDGVPCNNCKFGNILDVKPKSASA